MAGWRAVLEALPLGVGLVEASGRVSYLNPAARQLLEKGIHANAETPELRMECLLASSSLRAAIETLRSNVTSAHTLRATLDEGDEVQVTLARVGTGRKDRLLVVLQKPDSQVGIGCLSLRDIEVILNGSPDEIFVTDGQGYTLWVNAACERLYGMKAEELIGRHVSELEKEGIFFPSITPYVLEKKGRVSIIQNTKNGQKIALTANPIFDEQGNIVRIINNARDITDLTDLYRELAEKVAAIEGLQTTAELELLGPANFVFESKVMQEIMRKVEKVAPSEATVLLLGESGTGKDAIARIIHEKSKRSQGPFIKVNCAAIPESLLESELFGYDPGAFTGARKQGKPGFFELAHGGTIFLNEISEISANLQVKLLQVIQDRQVVRVGGTKVINLDVRIITASNKDLKQLVQKGAFREDLFFRINVVPLHLPPLRERQEDIPALIRFYLNRFNARYGLRKTIDPEVVEALVTYSWPGNIRELQNLIERLVVISDGDRITRNCLPEEFLEAGRSSEVAGRKAKVPSKESLKESVAAFEREMLFEAYQKYKSTYKVARELGISQPTVVRKLRKYGLSLDCGS